MKNFFVLISIGLGAILLVSGLTHLVNPFFFARSIGAYQIASPSIVFVVAGLLPAFQIVVGVALLMGIWKRFASLLALMMFSVFSVVQIYALAIGLEISCGCFGYDTSEISLRTVGVPVACLVFAGLNCIFLSDDDAPRKEISNAIHTGVQSVASE